MKSNSVITTVFSGYNQLFQDGMTRLLGERFNIVRNAGSLQDTLAFMQSSEVTVDLIIADPQAPKASEFQTISEISNQFPETKLIILTSHIDHALLEIVTHNGAAGVLSDNISTTALLYSIEIVLLGERVAPMILSSSTLVPSKVRPSEASTNSKNTALSARENQILRCLVEGLPNKSIARNLDIAEPTVKVHLKMLLRKLQVQNRTQAAIWALNNGYSQNDETIAEVAELRAIAPNGTVVGQLGISLSGHA